MMQGQGKADMTSRPDADAVADPEAAAAATAMAGADQELSILLVRAAKAMVDRLREERRDANHPTTMTVVHGLAARYLVDRDDVTAVELAHYLGVTKQSTSEVVATLEREGIVRRAPHPTDGRARVILLTPHGRKKLIEGRERWLELERDWASMVEPGDLEVVRRAVSRYLIADSARRAARHVGP
jgi:DNA-binding MarR family transcriptional regulator